LFGISEPSTVLCPETNIDPENGPSQKEIHLNHPLISGTQGFLMEFSISWHPELQVHIFFETSLYASCLNFEAFLHSVKQVETGQIAHSIFWKHVPCAGDFLCVALHSRKH